MSKYNSLRNKQKLAKALEEIGMTIEEAKRWLSAAPQFCPENSCDGRKTADSCDSNQATFPFWTQQHEEEYDGVHTSSTDSELEQFLKDLTTKLCENPTKAKPCTQSAAKQASNVTFVAADDKGKVAVCVGGVRVTGEYRASYIFESECGQAVLQVEFVQPSFSSAEACAKHCS